MILHERSIGGRLGACGVVGTEVAVAVDHKASAPRIGPLPGDHRLRKGPGAFIIRSCCEHEGPEADGRGGRTDDWRPVGASPRAALQAYEAAARLYEQAAAELDQAAAHCRVAATHFRGAEVPPGAAHAWAALGHLREAELRLEEQARIHRLKARL